MQRNAATVRKIAVLGIKLMMSVFFIVILLRIVRAADILDNFKQLDVPYLLALIPLAIIVIWISCVKWRMLLGDQRGRVSTGYLMSLYLLGYFFSNFLPSMVGGDAARGYYLGQRIRSIKSAYLSVLLERLTGLFALIGLVAILALGNHPIVQTAGIRVLLLALSIGLSAAVMGLFSKRIFTMALKVIPRRYERLHEKLTKAHRALTSFRQHPAEFVMVILLSLAFHLLAGVNLYIACRALHATPSLIGVMLVTPLIMLASMIPISLNGAGLWEGSFVICLSFLGVTESIAVSAALLLRFKTLILSIVGWAVYLTQRDKPKELDETVEPG